MTIKKMIEVFKTNISNSEEVSRLEVEIQKAFAGYKVNFDLSDCDRILRVVYEAENFCVGNFIYWLKTKGCIAEVLPD